MDSIEGPQSYAYLCSDLKETQEQERRESCARDRDPVEGRENLEGEEQKVEPNGHAKVHLIGVRN